MKYTVVIQQPVQDEVRAELEQQLVQRMGLSESAATKLAGRRSGRLLKPTTRPKAEKLLDVFRSAGVSVELEEVPEEGELTGLGGAVAPAVSPVAPTPTPATPVPAATPAATAPAAVDPFGADPFAADPFAASAAADPFGSDPFGADPFGTDPFGSDPFGVSPAAGSSTQVFSAAPGSVKTSSDSASAPAAADDEWASFAQGLSGETTSAPAKADSSEDVWSDFADSLKVDVPVQQKVEVAPAPLTPSFLDVAEEGSAAVVDRGPRRSLARQLLTATLLPTAALTLVSLLLLSTLLPVNERNRSEAQARVLAQTLSDTVATDPGRLQQQLDRLVAEDEIGFARVQLPNGSAYFASDAEGEGETALRNSFEKWAADGAGNFRDAGTTYTVGQSGAVAEGAQAAQVEVGVPYRFNLWSILLPWLLTSLLLIGLAWFWGQQAIRAILAPIRRLVDAATAISAGDLSQPVKVDANDEVGDLAETLERMRLSLSAAMDRLRRRKR